MNLSLLDPFILAQDCPEALVGRLHSGHSTCLRFNRKGDLLASGRLDGTIAIFDVDTNGVARKLRGHTRQVQSLSWSADGRYLLSASQDWKCVLWDLKDGTRVKTVRFEAPVFIAELHPSNHLLFAAALFDDQPVLVDVAGPETNKRILPSAPKRTDAERENATEKQLAQDAKQLTTVTTFSPSGYHIIAGTNKGWLNIIDTETCETQHSERLSSNLIISIRLTPSGRDMVLNSSDRVVRTLHLPDLDDKNVDFDNFRLENEHKYQDIVNRLSWNHVATSPTGEYIVASIYMNHHLYVWETGHSSLEKILEGPREELSFVEWHPHKPFLAASGMDTGHVYVWSVVAPQRWSALAPDFMEVEENVEYAEREDEFDIQPAEEIQKRIMNQEDEDIDVLTIEEPSASTRARHAAGEDADGSMPNGYHGRALGAGILGGDDAFRMPVVLDLEQSDDDDDVIAIGPGEFRRKEWALDGAGDEGSPAVGDAGGS